MSNTNSAAAFNLNNGEEAVVTEIKFEQNGEIAIVRQIESRVEVERGGTVTPFRPQYTIEDITNEFTNNGWKEVPAEPSLFAAPVSPLAPPAPPAPEPAFEVPTVIPATFEGLEKGVVTDITAHSGSTDPKVVDSAVAQNITIATQKEVDEYLVLHKQMSELKKQQDKLKKSIKAVMDKDNLKEIKGTLGQLVYLQDATASNSTSVFSDYDLEDVRQVLDGKLLKQVTEIRINATKLDGLLKVEKLPAEKVKEIRALKISNPGTPRFAVKK